jgi:hypothetical protein
MSVAEMSENSRKTTEISPAKEYRAKLIYYYMLVTLGDKRPSYCTFKYCAAGFRTDHLSTEAEGLSGRPTQVTIPENVDAIHSIIVDT